MNNTINPPDTDPRGSVNLAHIAEEDNPALAALSNQAYRLYINMIVWAQMEGSGIVELSRINPRPFENLTTALELENAGLIHRATHLNDVGEHVFTGAFFIPVFDKITY